MANHASAEKRNRQRIKRTDRNRSAKSALRTLIKKTRLAIGEGVSQGANELLVSACSALDKAASKGIIPSKRADRVKSRLSIALAKLSKK